MSFTLSLVARRAGGGEITRTRALETAEPVIGRAADCDIRLADLAMEMRHARLSLRPDGIVHVEALGEYGLDVNGRARREADLEPNGSDVLTIGRHRFAFRRGEAGEVVVSVSPLEEAQSALTRGDEEAIFTPRSRLFGRRSLSWAFGAVVLALCLALPIVVFFAHDTHRLIHADRQWNGGPLSKAHAFLQNDCQACHRQAFVAVRDDACLSCHGRTGAGRLAIGRPTEIVVPHAPQGRLLAATPPPPGLFAKARLLVAKSFHHPNERCASCHLEHVSARRSAVSSGAPRDVPFPRVENSCADCHGALRSRLQDTVLRNTPDWIRHPDFRPYVAVRGPDGEMMERRVDLTPAAREATGLLFSHSLHLLAGGGVARYARELGAARGYGESLQCASCHHLDTRGRGFLPVSMERDCEACHTLAFARTGGGLQSLPHGSVARMIAAVQSVYSRGFRGNAAGTARRRPGEQALGTSDTRTGSGAEFIRASFAPGGACAFCHVVDAIAAGTLSFKVRPVPQLTRRLPLGAFDHGVAAHRVDAAGRPACGGCHMASGSTTASDVLIPSISRCAGCHGRPAAVVPAKADCTECHAYHDPGRPENARSLALKTASWSPKPDYSSVNMSLSAAAR